MTDHDHNITKCSKQKKIIECYPQSRQNNAQTADWKNITTEHTNIDPNSILNIIASIIIVIDKKMNILYANNAAEQFFQSSETNLRTQQLDQLLPRDSPLFSLICQAQTAAGTVVEYQLTLASPRLTSRVVNVHASPIPETESIIVISMQERSLAAKIDRQLTHRGAARSVGAMAAMLAHEVKNPLAGIRGAAQLLEESVRFEDKSLTRLICDETDRVCALVDRMELFSVGGPFIYEAVNIHEVLVRVRTLAENSFGKHLNFHEQFDPSLPLVRGNRDQLIQVFLNLIKNAAEAAPNIGGEVIISTAYWHGVRFAVSSNHTRTHLPLMISVQDNGEGIPEEIRPHLFEPFVTSKPKGSGLGLALVAKIIGDHAGLIEFDDASKGTIFRVMLPMHTDAGRPK